MTDNPNLVRCPSGYTVIMRDPTADDLHALGTRRTTGREPDPFVFLDIIKRVECWGPYSCARFPGNKLLPADMLALVVWLTERWKALRESKLVCSGCGVVHELPANGRIVVGRSVIQVAVICQCGAQTVIPPEKVTIIDVQEPQWSGDSGSVQDIPMSIQIKGGVVPDANAVRIEQTIGEVAQDGPACDRYQWGTARGTCEGKDLWMCSNCAERKP